MNLSYFIDKILISESLYSTSIFETKKKNYSFINPYGYHLLRKNEELYKKLDGLFIDGLLMCIFVQCFYRIRITRRSFDMTAVAYDLFHRLEKTKENIFFVGAKQDEIDKTVSLIKESYPQMTIAGYRNGFFVSEYEKIECINEIIKLNPDFVIVGMGAILQEQFILQLQKEGFQGICFTCGGYLRQASTGVSFYPAFINRFNLRAFYRLYKEKGMFKRLYNVLIQFPILFVYDYCCSKIVTNK